MSRPSTVRKPTATELGRIHRRLENPLLPWQRRRAEVLLLHAADQPVTRIAQPAPGPSQHRVRRPA